MVSKLMNKVEGGDEELFSVAVLRIAQEPPLRTGTKRDRYEIAGK